MKAKNTGRLVRAHRYEPHPLSSAREPGCGCGLSKNHRSHQPLWWRLLNPGVDWR